MVPRPTKESACPSIQPPPLQSNDPTRGTSTARDVHRVDAACLPVDHNSDRHTNNCKRSSRSTRHRAMREGCTGSCTSVFQASGGSKSPISGLLRRPALWLPCSRPAVLICLLAGGQHGNITRYVWLHRGSVEAGEGTANAWSLPG